MNNLEYNYKLDLVSNLVILSKVLEDEYSIHLQDFDSKSENLSLSQVEKSEDHYSVKTSLAILSKLYTQ